MRIVTSLLNAIEFAEDAGVVIELRRTDSVLVVPVACEIEDAPLDLLGFERQANLIQFQSPIVE